MSFCQRQNFRKKLNAPRCQCGTCPGCKRRIGRMQALAGSREQFGGRRPFEEEPAAAARLEAAGRAYEQERRMNAYSIGTWPQFD